MSWDKGLTRDGRPRKQRLAGSGKEPVITSRVPAPVIARLVAKAAERKISNSAITRDALCSYVEGERAA
jgi:hypothetical protein